MFTEFFCMITLDHETEKSTSEATFENYFLQLFLLFTTSHKINISYYNNCNILYCIQFSKIKI